FIPVLNEGTCACVYNLCSIRLFDEILYKYEFVNGDVWLSFNSKNFLARFEGSKGNEAFGGDKMVLY
ncbi:MAG: hypothetical protein ACRD7F_02455, partial [Nitrososphaeraceae archaeon]